MDMCPPGLVSRDLPPSGDAQAVLRALVGWAVSGTVHEDVPDSGWS